MYEWPGSLFQALYGAYVKRKVADELNLRRSLEAAAMWGNTNMDESDDKNLRTNFMSEIDHGYKTAIAVLYDDPIAKQDEEEIDYDDPFWAAMKRGVEKRKLPKTPTVPTDEG